MKHNFYIGAILLWGYGLLCSSWLQAQVPFNTDNFYIERFAVSKLSTDSAEHYFSQASLRFEEQKDTSNYLLCRSYLAEIDFRRGHFHQAFERAMEVRPLAQERKEHLPLIELNRILSELYRIYGKDSIAFDLALQNLELTKAYCQEGELNNDSNLLFRKGRRKACYLSIASHALDLGRMKIAKSYLDSCYIMAPNPGRDYYVDSFYAQYYLKKGEHERALSYLAGSENYMRSHQSGFLASVYRLYGEVYEGMQQTPRAISYYIQSIKMIDDMEVSLAGKPTILYRLATLYESQGYYQRGFQLMKQSKLLTDSLFTAQSNQNYKLFDLKNQYRQQVEHEQQVILLQQQELEASQRNRFLLLGLILLISLSSIVTFICVRLRIKVSQISREKNAHQADLEQKNKELTANALRFVEREQMMTEILEIIQAESPQLKDRIKQTLPQSNSQMWEEFNVRFIQTNSQFYDQLLKRHPSLTASDLKLCALLKLNFDSKEMARLMGISVGSVHVSRSRLRKRLGLDANVNLKEYLFGI